MEAAAQLALAQPELAGQRLDPRPRVGEPRHGGLDLGIAPASRRARRRAATAGRGRARLELRVQARGELRPQLGEIHAPVAQLAQRHPERRPPAPGRKRTPSSTLPGGEATGTGPVSGPATNAPRPALQIRSEQPSGSTSVRSRSSPHHPHPQAGERTRRRKLAISGPQIAHSIASQT